MVDVAQSVRASDCGAEGRGFEPHLPPKMVFVRRPFLLANSRKTAQIILYINDMRDYSFQIIAKAITRKQVTKVLNRGTWV